jgi:hypothetical protein
LYAKVPLCCAVILVGCCGASWAVRGIDAEGKSQLEKLVPVFQVEKVLASRHDQSIVGVAPVTAPPMPHGGEVRFIRTAVFMTSIGFPWVLQSTHRECKDFSTYEQKLALPI